MARDTTEREGGFNTPDNRLTHQIIGATIDVHRELRPGLLESTYEECLAHELTLRGIPFERQKPVPVRYKGLELECGYRLDILVDNHIILELKAVETILPVHQAQLLTYLKLTGCKIGILLNFNVAIMREGIKRLAR
jgi:GxxExxY protein